MFDRFESTANLWILLNVGFDLHDGFLEVLVDYLYSDIGSSFPALGSSADPEAG